MQGCSLTVIRPSDLWHVLSIHRQFMEPAEALLKLGLQFLDSGCYPQAAKCLLAVCNSNALPATLATARLLLGQLLLNHTHDIAQSKEHLTAAVSLAAQMHPPARHLASQAPRPCYAGAHPAARARELPAEV